MSARLWIQLLHVEVVKSDCLPAIVYALGFAGTKRIAARPLAEKIPRQRHARCPPLHTTTPFSSSVAPLYTAAALYNHYNYSGARVAAAAAAPCGCSSAAPPSSSDTDTSTADAVTDAAADCAADADALPEPGGSSDTLR